MKKIRMSEKLNKLLCSFVAVCMVLCVLHGYHMPVNVHAATDSAFEKSISAFPDSYKSYLRTLHNKYPKWKFVAYNTGINFQTAVNKEFSNNRSLIENSFSKLLKSNGSGNYNVSTGTYIAKDGGTWVSASKNCVAYFMDPRNFLNSTHIYMFEQLSYDSSTQTKAGVEAILQGSFMHKTKIGYITTKGKYKSTDIYYSDQILEAAKQSKVSAYYLASKIIQEIGTKANSKYAGMGASGSVSGTYSKSYTGIYNFYNIGATSSGTPIANGLSWASSGSGYSRPWNTPMKSINGGAEYIGEKYINCGQNTVYYQRFNVNKSSTYALYTHQYMTNIYGAASEASITAAAYESLGIASLAKTFVIPVYKSMPKEGNTIKYGSSPKTGTIISGVNLRKKANTTSNIVTTLNSGDKVTITKAVMTSSEFNSRWLSNPYWFKVKIKKSGKTYKGFIAATFLKLNQEYSLVKGKSMTAPVTLGKSETIYYRSDDPAIASVTKAGKITGKSAGTVTIYAFTAAGRFSATSVRVYASGCAYSSTSITLDVGKSKKMPATVYPQTAKDKTVTYTSSNKAVATVTSAGKIKAKAPGTAIITATPKIGGASAKCTVKVIQPVSGIKLNKKSLVLKVGSGHQVFAEITPKNASVKTVTWTSSNKKVATVDKTGIIRGVAPGTVTISVKSNNGLMDSCDVTIVQVPKKTKIKSLKSEKNTVTLEWSKAKEVSGYEIYRSVNSSKEYKKVKTIHGNKTFVWTNSDLKSGNTYYYKIRTYKKVSGQKIYGNDSKQKKIKLK